MQNKQLILPIVVISPIDIARLLREARNLDEFFRQAAIREGGQPQNAPRYSRLLDELVVANNVNLLDEAERAAFLEQLAQVQEQAPILHMSFSADPPGAYVQKIVSWLRQNIQPNILVRVGLQPQIGAGCIVRTTNKSFDFSLRRFFDSKQDFFREKLHQVIAPELETMPAEAEVAPAAVVDEQPQPGAPA